MSQIIINFWRVTKDKEEGTEAENKFLDCNWSPKFVNSYIRNCNSGMAILKN
jgi:hypothetical protein